LGYELHITRAEFWAENVGQSISSEEWLRLVEQDPELTIDEQNGPLFVYWGPVSREYSPWFDWSGGNVHTKNADRNTLAKMLQIAASLGAVVQGDEGEVYTSPEDFPEILDTGKTGLDGRRVDDADLPLPLKRERIWARFEYIVVGLIVLAWLIYDLASG